MSDSNAISKFMKKMKFLKDQIRVWVKDKKEYAYKQKKTLKEKLADIDLLLDKGKGDSDVINQRAVIFKSLQDIEKLDSKEVAQKVKIKWAIEGDENSKYYHGVLNKRRSQLTIRGILVDGTWIDSPSLVKSEFLSHFTNRFNQPGTSRILLNMDFPNKLNLDQQIDLESDVTRDEIKRAVWDCGIDKSPGPDGFTFGFYRRYWSFLEKDVVQAVNYFFQHGVFPKGGNSSFIALIPKTQNANMVKDFRPITLIGSLYKIIAKILSNRLVVVLGDIVNEVQSAFVANRQILDGPFILNELLHWCKKKKKQTIFFKVDFEKAYDSVRWDYLDDVLKNFGFGDRWRGWIQGCLRSSRGSIIVNGSPTNEFQFHRGLKQGDPLSAFLFILVMESLHISVQRVVDAGMFKGISLGSFLYLSHVFYADDAVFMGQWSSSNIDIIIQVLECFYRASGLRINMTKSKLM
ncbi:RNA-directed DNA polymerase, eukaryota [Tanacetum coccineum]|uniref:RNA-directed DNA polymerase, eukaryota n=1 Tax=Tanacetum coccineum TaxID=301880 RepID=A0ABQ5JFP7_9ASTR